MQSSTTERPTMRSLFGSMKSTLSAYEKVLEAAAKEWITPSITDDATTMDLLPEARTDEDGLAPNTSVDPEFDFELVEDLVPPIAPNEAEAVLKGLSVLTGKQELVRSLQESYREEKEANLKNFREHHHSLAEITRLVEDAESRFTSMSDGRQTDLANYLSQLSEADAKFTDFLTYSKVPAGEIEKAKAQGRNSIKEVSTAPQKEVQAAKQRLVDLWADFYEAEH